MAIIADTGGVLVLFDQSHPKHQATVESLDERLIVPSLILPEIDYLSRRLPRGAMRAFMSSLLTQEFEYYELDLPDLQRANEIMIQYADANIGLGRFAQRLSTDCPEAICSQRVQYALVSTRVTRKWLTKTVNHFEICPSGRRRCRRCRALEHQPYSDDRSTSFFNVQTQKSWLPRVAAVT